MNTYKMWAPWLTALAWTLGVTVLFIVLSLPATYRMTQGLGNAFRGKGTFTTSGLALHAAVFGLVVWTAASIQAYFEGG